MEMSERKRRILRSIVETYIHTAEPVGSKTLAQMPGFGFSSATIRSEMADLEALGYLEQPHTSAGRVPSPQGYRFYVNELMNEYRLSVEESEHMRRALLAGIRELDKMVSEAGRMTSHMTRFPVYTISPSSRVAPTISRYEIIPVDSYSFIVVVMTSSDIVHNRLVRLPFKQRPESLHMLTTLLNTYFTNRTMQDITQEMVDECASLAGSAGTLISLVLDFAGQVLESQTDRDVFLTGASRLLNYPEYHNVQKARDLMDFLSEENPKKLPEPDENQQLKILIGPENVEKELRDTSVVVVSYNIGGGQRGVLGVVGPTRMDYAKVAASLSYIAEGIRRIFLGEFLPPFDR